MNLKFQHLMIRLRLLLILILTSSVAIGFVVVLGDGVVLCGVSGVVDLVVLGRAVVMSGGFGF